MSSKKRPAHRACALEEYFTNAEEILSIFDQMLLEKTPEKRILCVHGVGGVGKSTVLKMFHLRCGNTGIPVGLASGEVARSPLDVLSRWSDDLRLNGANLRSFRRMLRQYRSLLAKVVEEASTSSDVRDRTVDFLSKATTKAAEATAGALAGAAVGSFIPGVGTVVGAILGGAVAGTGAEAAVDWLRGFLSKSEVDLIVDSSEVLTESFLGDLADEASGQRLVLLLDALEQTIGFDEWLCDLARRSPVNVLLLLAGRVIPNWDTLWPGWLASARIHELKPMSPEIMADLTVRYYSTQRKGYPDPEQVAAIVQFARGLPLAVTSAVRLWVKYGVEDFQAIRPEVGADLVDCLLNGVPIGLRPAIEAAGTLRWFNRDLIAELCPELDAIDVYEELRQFPFVSSRPEGLTLHEVVRSIIDENLEIHSPDHHRLLHERAANYFEVELARNNLEHPATTAREHLYHLVVLDEKCGVQAFQQLAESLARHSLVGRLRPLLNDVNTYRLQDPNSRLWRDYYNARLLHMSLRFSEAEEVYKQISEDPHAEPKLRAYAYCDLGQIWARNQRLTEPGGVNRALGAIERSRQFGVEMDSKLALNYSHLRYVHMFGGFLDKAVDELIKQHDYYRSAGDKSGSVYSLDMLKDLYGLLGDWKAASDAEKAGLEVLGSMSPNPFLRTRLVGHNIWHKIWSGRYSKAEQGLRQALAFARQEGYVEGLPSLYRDLGLVIGLQQKWRESRECFVESITRYHRLSRHSIGLGSALGFWGLVLAKQNDIRTAEEYLLKSLSLKRQLQDNNGIPEILIWLGEICETKALQSEAEERITGLCRAESYYNQTLEYGWTSRRYYECAALTALLRTSFSRQNFSDMPALFLRAEEIAQKYRYHDLLAYLYLYKGHAQWCTCVAEWESGFEAVRFSYKQSMLYSLAYNRYLLDAVVWGHHMSPLVVTLIAQCSLLGPEGKQMLESLASWWKSDVYDLGTDAMIGKGLVNGRAPRITEVEDWARRQEPGNGSAQSRIGEILDTSFRGAIV